MAPVSGLPPKSAATRQAAKKDPTWSLFRLPRNVYLLLIFTLGKGFQLSIANLTLAYYVHSLGYQPDFIGLFSAMPAIGALVAALPTGLLADRLGRKPVLLMTAWLTPICLALLGLLTSAPLLLACNFLQGLVSTAYWVTNLPLLVDSTNERQRVGVLALNSFLLLGVGALGNLLGGAIPGFVAAIVHASPASSIPLRWSVFSAALFTFVFGLPLWFLHEPGGRGNKKIAQAAEVEPDQLQTVQAIITETSPTVPAQPAPPARERSTLLLFTQLLLPDLLFTMGEGAVVALIQIYFVLRFQLLPGPLGVIFTISGLVGGVFSLTAPLFVKRWSKLRIITIVQYVSAPLMVLIGYAPIMPLAIAGEYARSMLRTLIEPVYAAFEMEQVPARLRSTLAGCYAVTWSVGFSVGPTIAGWLQVQVSLSASFIFGALCLLVAPTLLLWFFGRSKTNPA
jgi:MFS family permease